MRPHQQVSVSGHTHEHQAACRGRGLPSPHAGMAQLWAKAPIYPSRGCGMQKAGTGAIHHQAHDAPRPERGVPAHPFRGAGMESIHLVGGRGSAARGSSAGELRSRLPFLCRGFWRSWTTWLEGRAGLGSSPRPPPTQVSGRLFLYLQRHQGIFLINAKSVQTALGEQWEAPAPAMAGLLCAWGPAEPRGQRSQLLR